MILVKGSSSQIFYLVFTNCILLKSHQTSRQIKYITWTGRWSYKNGDYAPHYIGPTLPYADMSFSASWSTATFYDLIGYINCGMHRWILTVYLPSMAVPYSCNRIYNILYLLSLAANCIHYLQHHLIKNEMGSEYQNHFPLLKVFSGNNQYHLYVCSIKKKYMDLII